MSDQKPRAIYKPGELDATRRNLGDISEAEAKRVAGILGGEIGIEKSKPIDTELLRSRQPYAKGQKVSRKTNVNKPSKEDYASYSSNKKTEKKAQLPVLNSKEKTKFDRLMASSAHKIKRPQNFINFLLSIGKAPDRVSPSFVTVRLVNDMAHMQKFFTAVKTIISEGDVDYRMKITEFQASRFKFLRFINEFNLNSIKEAHKKIGENPENVTVADMIPFIQEIYRPLLKIFYLGEKTVVKYVRDTYNDVTQLSKTKQAALVGMVREASTEWMYIYNQVIKGLYPLLMRMVCNECLTFAKFFNKYGSKILVFLDMTKFDIILPEEDGGASLKEEEAKFKAMEEAKKKENEKKEEEAEDFEEESSYQGEMPKSVRQALNALEMIFPDAGWMNLGNGTDLYPYFQPIYKFPDGFNLLSEKNPMQVVIVLLRILEDMFQGCRNIKFMDDKDLSDDRYKDTISTIFSEWTTYEEDAFERNYIPTMNDLANHLSTQIDFGTTPYARKQIASMLWLAKMVFLPYIEYEFFFMEKNNINVSYRPLPNRVRFLKQTWSTLITRIEKERAAAKATGKELNTQLLGSENILDTYTFSVPNTVSRRLDALYGLKSRTNLTLLKYTLSVIIVLNWWIWDKNSPAYKMDVGIPYRLDSDEKTILFSVPTRSDQNIVFNRYIKARQAQAAKAREKSANANQNTEPKEE
ncbi:MAG: hypothetical protein K5839_02625 [Treponemataceae bacterium]|nr:hypothetical protein [Treponemataceae bacterium]